MNNKTLDIIALGRLGLDLYAQQVGARLEDAGSMGKYLGGSSGNIAFGTARLGLKSAMLTRLGNEQVGRSLIEELEAVGCDTSQIALDDERLTGLVLLGIKDKDTFPLVFYRENVADMAIDADDIKEEFIASAKALVITGTHLSTDESKAASLRAIEYARKNGTKTALDIDYRPVLWGLTGRGDGETRFVADGTVTEHLQSVIDQFDLIVGTEEEIHIAGGSTDTVECLKVLRKLTNAEIVVKRGPLGAAVFTGEIPDTLDEGICGVGVRVEVLNVLGAGDAFMSGLLKGWVLNEGWEKALSYGNACGALVVSRHGCAPAMPTAEELEYYIENADSIPRPDLDSYLNYLHRVTTRKREWNELAVLAFDHRRQLANMAIEITGTDDRVAELKDLLLQGARMGGKLGEPLGNQQYGLLCDDSYGQDVLNEVTGNGWWVGRPIEKPSSRPLEFDHGNNVGCLLTTWPEEQVAKCLVFYHPDDPIELRLQQERKVVDLYEACVATGNELLLEIIPPADGPASNSVTLLRSMARFYNLGVFPDWWKLPPQTAQTWQAVDELITRRAPHCRGVVMLGLDMPVEKLSEGFTEAAKSPVVKGFMVGRTIFSKPAADWLENKITNDELVRSIADNYFELIKLWRDCRDGGAV